MKKILFFGPYGSNTQIAAEQLSDGIELEPVCSIKKIINSVDQDPNLMGVIPIENSIEGTVRESIDNLIKTTDNNVQIIKETIVPIKHCLISNAKSLDEIKEVYSHPQALAQCNGYIIKNLANAHTIAAPNTAEAVKITAKKDTSTAAIANKKAAEIYNVPVLSEDISDEPDNKTRFVLIGRTQLPKTGNDRTSFAFSTINKSGALADVMSVFKKYNINLSSIESRPSKKTFGTYTFFLECEAYITDENLQFSLAEIKPMTTFIRFLGSYPQF